MTTLTTRVSHQDNIFVDLFDDHRNEDFAELSNLLGDVFSTSASGGFESTLSGSDDVKEFVSSPVFNFLPPQATRSAADESESLLAGMDKSQAAQFYGQILEPARVSPTPSASANFALSDSTFLSAPQTKRHVKRVGLQSTQPESGSRSRKRKSHELQTSNDQPTVPGAPLKQKDRRRERNREHAKRSRSKKKDLTKHLEETAEMLREENNKIKEFVQKRLGTSEDVTNKMIKERIVTPTDRFIAALQKPSHRILSNSAIKYLNGLGKESFRR